MSKPKKPAANATEKKTPGTVIVEKYRPTMNKLTDAQRETLMAGAMVTIYGQRENAGHVDTNVPLDLAHGVGDVADALDVIHGRIAGARLIAGSAW